MKSNERLKSVLAQIFQKAQKSKPLGVAGSLCWLSFAIPCLGAAQDFSDYSDPALELQVEVDEEGDFLASEERDSANAEIGIQVPTPAPHCYAEPKPSCAPCEKTVTSVDHPCMIKEHVCWPVPNASISVDFLYFYAMLENLRYGMKNPQNLTNTPVVANIDQRFDYDMGARVNIMTALNNYWELGITWTYFNADPDGVTAYSADDGIYTSLQAPVFVTTGNFQCQNLSGKWGMRMNVWDVMFKKPFCIGSSLMFSPEIGAQCATFRQDMRVHYGNYFITDAGAESPQVIKGTNSIWAVGPEVAIESRFLAPRKLDLFLRASYSGMLGKYKAKTNYHDLLLVSPDAFIKVRNAGTRLFSMVQIQAAISKRWDVGDGLAELMAGYETQFWEGINNWDYFGTFSIPSSDGNFMLAGPFARFTISF